MSTRLAIQYGELVTDTAIHRANPLPSGVYVGMVPTAAPGGGGSITVTLSPDPTQGISVWRTKPTTAYHGSVTVYEDANVVLNVAAPSAQPRIDLLVASHVWVQGPIDAATGKPTGELLASMLPRYSVVQGVPGANPVAPSVQDPIDVDGRRAIILASIRVNTDGSYLLSRWPTTDMRQEAFLKTNGGNGLDPSMLPWGASMVPVYADVATMQSVNAATRVNSQLALVPGIGLFQYFAASSATVAGLDVVAPNDSAGRWVRQLAPGSGGGGADGAGGSLFLFSNFV